MNILQILVCSLFANFMFVCVGKPAPSQVQGNQTRYQPQAGLVVSINPEKLCRQGLIQSWQEIDEPFRERQVKSTSFSKVDFKLSPNVSFDGALLALKVNGTSVGESSMTRNSREIITDSLTKFTGKQNVFIDPGGIKFGSLDLSVDNSQSFNRSASRNPFAGGMANSRIKRSPDRLESQSNEFAGQQIRRRLSRSLDKAKHASVASVTNLINRHPFIAEFAWQFSSDSENVYLVAETNDIANQTIPENEAAISVFLHESTARQLFDRRLSNQTLDSASLEQSYSRNSQLLNLPQLDRNDGQPWSVSFLDNPANITFENDQLKMELVSNKLTSGDRSISSMAIRFSYRLQNRNGKWHLVRNERVDVYDSRTEGQRLGARQTAFKTVMRKRFERILPKSVVIPGFNRSGQLGGLGVELEVVRVYFSNHNLVIAINSR